MDLNHLSIKSLYQIFKTLNRKQEKKPCRLTKQKKFMKLKDRLV